MSFFLDALYSDSTSTSPLHYLQICKWLWPHYKIMCTHIILNSVTQHEFQFIYSIAVWIHSHRIQIATCCFLSICSAGNYTCISCEMALFWLTTKHAIKRNLLGKPAKGTLSHRYRSTLVAITMVQFLKKIPIKNIITLFAYVAM